MATGAFKNPTSLRFMSVNDSDVNKCVDYGKTPSPKCLKKVATACRTPNASVKCVSLSMETPCERIDAPAESFLEMLQAQDVFKLQKTCLNECCCQAYFTTIRKPLKTNFTDVIQMESRC